MICPKCMEEKHTVADSRRDVPVNAILRRRECKACGYRWTTVEVELDPAPLEAMRAVCAVAAKLLPKAGVPPNG